MMKKWLCILFLLIMLPMTVLADEAVTAEWWEIADQIRTGESGAVGDGRVYVRIKGSNYMISTHPDLMSRGEIAHLMGVRIDARDTAAHRFYVKPDEAESIEDDLKPSPAGTYIFENIAIDGDVSVFAYEWYDAAQTESIQKMDKNSPTLVVSPVTGYALRMEEFVILSEDAAIEVYAGACASQGKREPAHYFNGGSVEVKVDCKAKRVTIEAHSGGTIQAEVTAGTESLRLDSYDGSDATLRNLPGADEANAKCGSIYVSIANQSKGELVNKRDATWLMLESVEKSKLTVENTGDLGMLEFHAEVDGDIKLTNDGTVKNEFGYDGNGWGDQAVVIAIDESSHINIVGKGKILPGYQHFDYYLGNLEMQFKTPKPGASMIIDLREMEFDPDSYADNVENARKVAKRVSFDWKQIESGKEGFEWKLSDSNEAPPHAVLAVYRDERAFIWPITKNNVYHPALKNERELDVLPADYDEEIGLTRTDEPKVLLDGKPDKSTDVYLNIEDHEKESGRILYELQLIDAWGDAYDPGTTVELYLPYPDVNQPEKKEYEIYHTLKNSDVDYYSTLDGTIQKLENGKGMLIEVRSFSPFEVVWDKGSDVTLPSTGDNSRLLLWLMLLVVSGKMMSRSRRRTA